MSLRLLAAFRSRLSRRIAFWIFLNFMAVEGIVLIPSVIRQADRLADQMRQVSDAKIQWIVEENPAAGPLDLLAAVERLQGPDMVGSITGATLHQPSTGRRLGGFGIPAALPLAEARSRVGDGRWLPLQGAYEGVWGGDALPDDLLLVVRHEDADLRRGVAGYVGNIVLIVLGIAAVLTITTLLVMRRLVIDRVLTLQEKLTEAGQAFQEGAAPPRPEDHLVPVSRCDELGEVQAAFNRSFLRTSAEMERRREAERTARSERDRAEGLLLNILPPPIAEEMKQGRHLIAETHADVSVLFADIVGFTSLSGRLSCGDLVGLLNRIFSTFDGLTELHGLEKIKTIGDNYMAVAGLPFAEAHHAEAAAAMALDMQALIAGFTLPGMERLALRIGIHSGPVVAGVIGRKKFIYDLWGKTVNIASRMESSGLPGRIQVSADTRGRLCHRFCLEPRGRVPIKGVGELGTWWLCCSLNPPPVTSHSGTREEPS